MEKKILVPTDFSENSWYAIQYAIKLYENQGCDFYILNTFVKDTYGHSNNTLLDPEETFNKLSENRSNEGLGDILLRISELDINLKHRFHMISRSSSFMEAVKSIVENLKIDMIIMGAKGMTSTGKDPYGKNSMAVIKNIRKCPILVVPKNATLDHPKEIILVTNLDIDFKISEIKHLVEIARLSKANIRVLSFDHQDITNPKQKSNKVLLQKYFRDINHTFNLLDIDKKKIPFNDLIKNSSSNIVSYIYKKPSFWEKFGFGNTIPSKLGYFGDVAVLSLNG